MGLETFRQELGEDGAGLRGREDRVERGAGGRPVVRVVEVLAPVPAHRGVAAHYDVGSGSADHARQVPAQAEGRLQDAVLIPQEHEVLHAEDPRRVPGLSLPDRHQAGARRLPLRRSGVVRAR